MKFRDFFNIGHRQVGGGADCLVIAEAGVSHFGDMGLARELVDMAAEAEADVFKTQIFDVDHLLSDQAMEWKNRLRARNLNFDQIEELKNRCESQGLIFMTTAHDESRINWLERLDVEAVKVGSGEKSNPQFITKLAKLKKPMIISTGMCDEQDLRSIVGACFESENESVALLHCVTSYPAPDAQVNLAAMDTMRSFFSGPVGYSDHTVDGLALLAAVGRGADVVERHITIKKNVANAQDWKVSSGPDDFSNFVKSIRRIESMIGDGVKKSADCENEGKEWALKSLFAARDIGIGHAITSDDLISRRPGTGIPPSKMSEIVGKSLVTNLKKGEMVKFDMLVNAVSK